MSALDLQKGFVYAEGVVRTVLDCTDCHKQFVAKLNHDLDGNHKIICPYCGHEHWRAIRKGVVTSDRWGSQNGPNRDVPTERMWTDKSIGATTSSAANYIRDKWLRRED